VIIDEDPELGVTVDVALSSQDDTAKGTCHRMNNPKAIGWELKI
jgi:hypothetical protein